MPSTSTSTIKHRIVECIGSFTNYGYNSVMMSPCWWEDIFSKGGAFGSLVYPPRPARANTIITLEAETRRRSFPLVVWICSFCLSSSLGASDLPHFLADRHSKLLPYFIHQGACRVHLNEHFQVVVLPYCLIGSNPWVIWLRI